MSVPEEQPTPEEPTPSDETASTDAIFPEEPVVLPDDFTPISEAVRLDRSRRRRAHRMLVPPGADARAAVLAGLARRAFPSFEFFLFALLSGAVLGAAYLMDSPALLLLGILLAPLLTPWVGMALAIQTGSWRFFFLTLGGLLVASLLVFLTGALAGWAGHLWLPLPLAQANFNSHLWWQNLLLVALGAVLLTISFVRSEQKPILPSIMLAYGLFMPLSAGGLGFGIGSSPIWPNGVFVFLVHLALAVLAGSISLAAMRFKPLKAGGFILPFLVALVSLGTLVYFTGLTKLIRDEIIATRRVAPTPTTLVIPSRTSTPRPTPTSTFTATATDTPLPTNTPQPTPAYAVITASSGGGALVRSGAGSGTVLIVLTNGIIVQVLPEIQSVNGYDWARVRWNDVNGWVLTTVLTATTATPPPTNTPTLTLTPTP
jgi:cell division septation protein DedD